MPKLEVTIAQAVEQDPRTVEQIAVAANISGTHLYNIINLEKPKYSIELDTARKLEEVLGVSFGIEI
jgi:hypothetical protein